MNIVQSYLGERTPRRIFAKEEMSSVFDNEPALVEADWAGYN